MDAFQFYPTPKELAQKAWSLFKNKKITRVLEPSAGRGDLCEGRRGLQEFRGKYYDSEVVRADAIDVIEIDFANHDALRKNGYNIVGHDFMNFQSCASYSHLILNPPFAAGAQHLLRCWDLAWEAEIVCILNSETVLNPFSADRQRLVELIESHGSYEIIEGAFKDAERETDVTIALVYLHKVADVQTEILGDLLSNSATDPMNGEKLAGDYQQNQEVALPSSVIENSVRAFNAAVMTMREAVKREAQANYYAALVGQTMAERNGDTGNTNKKDTSVAFVQEEMMKRYEKLKDAAWAGILRSTNVTSRLSSKVQSEVEGKFCTIKKLDFTLSNIYGFLEGFSLQQSSIQQDMFLDLFDQITKYHTENGTMYLSGCWKSNDKHYKAGMKIRASRFILPGFCPDSWSDSPSYSQMGKLRDFDKSFAALDGKLMPDYGLCDAFEKEGKALYAARKVETSYFSLRWFRGKGTLHFYPKDPALIDRLNRIVGRARQWIPPDSSVSEDFWKQYEQSEAFDEEVRSAIYANRHNHYDDPMWHWATKSGFEADKADKCISDALTSVLEKHGINVNFQLTDKQADTPALPSPALALPAPKTAVMVNLDLFEEAA